MQTSLPPQGCRKRVLLLTRLRLARLIHPLEVLHTLSQSVLTLLQADNIPQLQELLIPLRADNTLPLQEQLIPLLRWPKRRNPRPNQVSFCGDKTILHMSVSFKIQCPTVYK